MQAPLRANEACAGESRSFTTPAMLGAALLVACHAVGCGDCGRAPARSDSQLVIADDGHRPDGVPAPDAALAHDSGVDGPAPVCPPWTTSAPAGHGWLYARALSSTGVPLAPGTNHVDIYVRRLNDPLPGTRADAHDPCVVASYDQTTSKVRILAAAIGFSSQEREFPPQSCLATSPCSLELPPSLDDRYYVVAANGVSLREASDLPERERAKFAAAVGRDALDRSKALRQPVAQELASAEKATHVPALDLAIHYTESKLRKKCDARCLDEPSLDPAIRAYLKGARRPQRTDPFELRTGPERWHRP